MGLLTRSLSNVLKTSRDEQASINACLNLVLSICGKFSNGIAAFIVGSALFGMVLLSSGMDYACKAEYLLPNWSLLFLALLVLLLFLKVAIGKMGVSISKVISQYPKLIDTLTAIACAGLLILQVLICQRYAFVTDWDSRIQNKATGRLRSFCCCGITSHGAYYFNQKDH